jgi:predicted TIM-barrel fold metal-dependent hydrolase
MYSAARYFGADPAYATTPAKLVALARNFPGIPFIGTHMGSLDAPFEEIRTELVTCDNLYLDTSNAAHTLTEEQFTLLLNRFGPKRILFGTDWPWFLHSDEIPMIDRLADRAGFSREDKEALFYNNIAELLGLKKPSNG